MSLQRPDTDTTTDAGTKSGSAPRLQEGTGRRAEPAPVTAAERKWKIETANQTYPIRRVAVLGSGVMGSRIAAHIANAGFPVLMLDVAAVDGGDRNRAVLRALDALKASKPAALAHPSFAGRIAIGNFEDDLAKLTGYDWVIEAVAENIDIKRGLLEKVAPHLGAETIISTNTSGLSVSAIAEALPSELRKRWLGTHFFNPPRYMRLLEIIPAAESDPRAIASITRFAGEYLGKTIVTAKDSPNFIANRIGVFLMLNTMRIMQEMGLSVEEVDALTGSPLGWPKTGTFRLADVVGIDVLMNVAQNFKASLLDGRAVDERDDLEAPAAIREMVARGWLGDKTGQGFYKKQRGTNGEEERLALDLQTMEYRPSRKPRFPSLEMTKGIAPLSERLRALLAGDPKKDVAAAFYWQLLPDLWAYAANRIGEVSDSIDDIDRAMRSGFNWEMGPFAMWDAAGVANTAAKMRSLGRPIPSAVEVLLQAAGTSAPSWYRNEHTESFDPRLAEYRTAEQPGGANLAAAKRASKVFQKNPGASLVDIGDEVLCVEFHSKMNVLGSDAVSLITEALAPGSAAERNFRAFVINSEAGNFSAGANLLQLLLAAQDEEWDEIDQFIRGFQRMTQAVKFSSRPVVAAPFGLCLGGGTEVCLHAASRIAHLELYMGLVETSVGLLPAGGGCKEMVLRGVQAAAGLRNDIRGESVEIYDSLRKRFETIALAKVSTSAYEARDLGLLNEGDGISISRDYLLERAKQRALGIAESAYAPPIAETAIPVPGESVLANLKLGVHMMRAGEYISDHDVKIANQVASVLCGGAAPAGARLDEQAFLDLEREAFLSLCGEPKTQERIAFTLKTGKPLRN